LGCWRRLSFHAVRDQSIKMNPSFLDEGRLDALFDLI
jgi:hypothetical protein